MKKKTKGKRKKPKPFLCYWLVEYVLGAMTQRVITREKPQPVYLGHGIEFRDVWGNDYIILGNVVMRCLKPIALFALDLVMPDDVQAEMDSAAASDSPWGPDDE